MTLLIEYPGRVGRELKKLFKTYPRSKSSIGQSIKGLKSKPRQGNLYPGFEGFEVRKMRVGLKEHKISQRDGMRLIFLYLFEKTKIILLAVYMKNDYGQEQEVKKMIIDRLKEVLSESVLLDFDSL